MATGNAYCEVSLGGEGVHPVEVGERVGEGTRGVSRVTVAVSFRTGDLCGVRSL